jgi:hypothetical protein
MIPILIRKDPNRCVPLRKEYILTRVNWNKNNLYPNQDTFTIFDLIKDVVGYTHILINKEHYIVNTKSHQLIPCKNYSEAQEWCYKFSCPHTML